MRRFETRIQCPLEHDKARTSCDPEQRRHQQRPDCRQQREQHIAKHRQQRDEREQSRRAQLLFEPRSLSARDRSDHGEDGPSDAERLHGRAPFREMMLEQPDRVEGRKAPDRHHEEGSPENFVRREQQPPDLAHVLEMRCTRRPLHRRIHDRERKSERQPADQHLDEHEFVEPSEQ